jgi:AcrR family transcriptional regulator
MTADVNPIGEGATLRQAQTALTEQRILAAATELFLADGYVATTLEAVARRARVAARTVYVRFGTKAALFKRVVDVAVVGDTEPVDVLGRQWMIEAMTAPTLAGRIAAGAAAGRQIMERTGALFAVAQQAAAVEPLIAGYWQQGREQTWHAQDVFCTRLADDGLLPPGIDLTWLIDTTTVLVAAETYLLVTRMLGWDLDTYEAWVAATLTRLLADPGSQGLPLDGSVVDGGEEGGVGPDQGGVLQREQVAVGLAPVGDPLVGQVHRLGPVHRGGPDRLLGLAVEVAVEPDERFDQLVRCDVGLVLDLPVHAPPVDLEFGRLGRVGRLAVGEPHQGVEPAHAGPGALGVVVGVRRPQLVGPQHQPGAVHRAEPVHAEALPDQPDRGAQDLRPVVQVVPHPRAVFQVREPDGVEGPEPRRCARADLASAHELPSPTRGHELAIHDGLMSTSGPGGSRAGQSWSTGTSAIRPHSAHEPS